MKRPLLIVACFLLGAPAHAQLTDTSYFLPRDVERFPGYISWLKNLKFEPLRPVDTRNGSVTQLKSAYYGSTEDWENFFKFAASEKMTNLRAFAILAQELKHRNVALFGPGVFFDQAVKRTGVDLGLAIPAQNLSASIWEPVNDPKHPERILHLKVIFTQSFEHRFADDILPATLKVGFGKSATYWLDGRSIQGKLVETDICYNEKESGFINTTGIGGRKHGFLGVLQSILFFLPESINAMVIDKKGNLVTRALVNTTIPAFEETPRFFVKLKPSNP